LPVLEEGGDRERGKGGCHQRRRIPKEAYTEGKTRKRKYGLHFSTKEGGASIYGKSGGRGLAITFLNAESHA